MALTQRKFKELIRGNERDIIANKTDILDEVKEVVLMPEINAMTSSMAAAYFEVAHSVIVNALRKHTVEFSDDGVETMEAEDVKKLLAKNYLVQTIRYQYAIVVIKGRTYSLALRNQFILPKKAIMRLALMIPKSTVAAEIKKRIADEYEDYDSPESTFLLDADMRNKYGCKTEALDEVQPVNYLYNDTLTLDLAAKYFDCDRKDILTMYYRHFGEFRDVGCYEMASSEIPRKERMTIIRAECNKDIEKYIFFTPKGVLRIAMLLKNNVYSRKIRRELLRIMPLDPKPEEKQEEISTAIVNSSSNLPIVNTTLAAKESEPVIMNGTEQDDLLKQIGLAVISGDQAQLLKLCGDVIRAKNDEISKLETENARLNQIKSQLDSFSSEINSILNDTKAA